MAIMPGEFDALVWAKEFCDTFEQHCPGISEHEDWIMTWFANAIMAGYDEATRRRPTETRSEEEIMLDAKVYIKNELAKRLSNKKSGT